MSSFFTSLELDKDDLSGKFILIRELNHSNASFAMNSLMWKAAQSKEDGLILILFHYSFQHYQTVGSKLGYNLEALCDSNRAVVIEPMKDVVRNFQCKTDQCKDDEVSFINQSLQETTGKIRFIIEKLRASCKRLHIFVDNLSDMLHIDVSENEIILFVHFFRTLLDQNTTLAICVQSSDNDIQENLIANSLMHVADVDICVSGLKTGISSDVTGTIEVTKRNTNQEKKNVLLHFKLSDRFVKIFSPGNILC